VIQPCSHSDSSKTSPSGVSGASGTITGTGATSEALPPHLHVANTLIVKIHVGAGRDSNITTLAAAGMADLAARVGSGWVFFV